MANVILPLFYYLTIGSKLNLRNYHTDDYNPPLFSENDTVENVLNEFRSTYHVITDDYIHPSVMNVPIDIGVQLLETDNRFDYMLSSLLGSSMLRTDNFDHASLLIVTGYNTTVESVKEDAVPYPGWQNETSSKFTHYLNKKVKGALILTLVTVSPRFKGDLQIVRRKFRNVMGTSGSVGDDTVDLWNKTINELKQSEDMRGDIGISISASSQRGTDLKFPLSFSEVTEMFTAQKNVRNHVRPVSLYQGFKPLHDLDDQYVTVEKNTMAEMYMEKLPGIWNDLHHAHRKAIYLCMEWNLSEEDEEKCEEFESQVENLYLAVLSLTEPHLSIYDDIDEKAFDKFFEDYEKGLDNTTKNYFTAYKILEEKIYTKCKNDFLKPTRGYLNVKESEVIKKSETEGGLDGCKLNCVLNNRCRAVAYSEQDKKCLIYYRSTSTAEIIFSPEDNDFKIYDRICELNNWEY